MYEYINKMVSTEEFIKLIKDDNQEELQKLYRNENSLTVGWSRGIDFREVYNEIKDIENNSSVYRALGTWIYICPQDSTETMQAKGFYYLKKSEKLGNKGAKEDIKDLLEFRDTYQDNNGNFVDLATDVMKIMDDYIELEKRFAELERRSVELEKDNTKLLKRNEILEMELKYRPDGIGYMEAKRDFESHLV